jgi:hypothetical protein
MYSYTADHPPELPQLTTPIGTPPIHRTRELLPRSCLTHDRHGETFARYDSSRHTPEDWHARLDDGGLRRFQALSTSYIELSGTLLP